MAVERTVVEAQIRNTRNKPDIVLMENCGPLKRRAVQRLANPAVTNLGIDRIGTDLVPHRFAETACSILRDEALVVSRSVTRTKFRHPVRALDTQTRTPRKTTNPSASEIS